MTDDAATVPAGIDTTVPHPARIYDFFLGGKDNFASDRQAAEAAIAGFPDAPLVARQNRDFMRRAAAAMVKEGIRQFIDLGSGLPTNDNLHQITQRTAPDSRVVYIDNDPIVLAHGSALLADNKTTTVVTADLRDPQGVFDACEAAGIDFEQPVGLLMIAVLHFVPGDVSGLMHTYRSRLATGSWLALSHVTADGMDPERAEQAAGTYARTPSGLHYRTPEEIQALFGDSHLLEPGVVATRLWRPEAVEGLPQIGDNSRPTYPMVLAGVSRFDAA
ncbi:SAM-dependent methyltransferase [Actinocorallia sp. B10E7]|uniref:SAM-dependent methyltransferase n=1 Tax=Actinocorallia sp. B10E7 TaxID=3153558 RepID=UPI00325DDA14